MQNPAGGSGRDVRRGWDLATPSRGHPQGVTPPLAFPQSPSPLTVAAGGAGAAHGVAQAALAASPAGEAERGAPTAGRPPAKLLGAAVLVLRAGERLEGDREETGGQRGRKTPIPDVSPHPHRVPPINPVVFLPHPRCVPSNTQRVSPPPNPRCIPAPTCRVAAGGGLLLPSKGAAGAALASAAPPGGGPLMALELRAPPAAAARPAGAAQLSAASSASSPRILVPSRPVPSRPLVPAAVSVGAAAPAAPEQQLPAPPATAFIHPGAASCARPLGEEGTADGISKGPRRGGGVVCVC